MIVRETPFDEIRRNNEVLQTLPAPEYKGGFGSCQYTRLWGGCRAAYYNEGDYMAEEPWDHYHGRRGG